MARSKKGSSHSARSLVKPAVPTSKRDFSSIMFANSVDPSSGMPLVSSLEESKNAIKRALVEPVAIAVPLTTEGGDDATADDTKPQQQTVVKLQNRDVSKLLAPAFLKLANHNIDADISFRAGALQPQERAWAFALVKRHSQRLFEQSGFGWDDQEQLAALCAPEARHLVVYGRVKDDEQTDPNAEDVRRPLAFASFRFTLEGEILRVVAGSPTLFITDIHVDASARRRGIGRRLVACMETMAHAVGMSCVHVAHLRHDALAASFAASTLKGYTPARFDMLGAEAEKRAAQNTEACVLAKALTSKSSLEQPKTAAWLAAPPAPMVESGWEAVPLEMDEPQSGDGDDEIDELFNELIDAFRERQGRDPTDDEVAMWRKQLQEHLEDGHGFVPVL